MVHLTDEWNVKSNHPQDTPQDREYGPTLDHELNFEEGMDYDPDFENDDIVLNELVEDHLNDEDENDEDEEDGEVKDDMFSEALFGNNLICFQD